MKKIYVIILVILALSVVATTSLYNSKEMTIQPSEFSDETKKILEIFDNESIFFDLLVDETVKSQTITVWAYDNGVWVENGKTYAEIEYLESQIAIQLEGIGYDLYSINDNGNTKYSYPKIKTDFSKSTVIVDHRIEEPTPIVIDKEIPIWVKIGTDKNTFKTSEISEDFRNADCNSGMAVTITFSDKQVEIE